MMCTVILILSCRRSEKSKYGRCGEKSFTIETREDPNVLLLDAGDIFQGTPYFNYYGGELEFKLMSMMQYDAHDRKSWLWQWRRRSICANASCQIWILSANYDFKKYDHGRPVKPYKIFNKKRHQGLWFGIGIELDGLVDKNV
jgi:5'-nucleotidase